MHRARRRLADLASAEFARTELDARVREAQAGAIERSVDPALLEQSLEGLRRAYGRDRATGETLLDSLVECLRLAMPEIREGQHRAAGRAGAAWQGMRSQIERLADNAAAVPAEKPMTTGGEP